MLSICHGSSCHVSVAMVTVAGSCVPAGVCRQCMLTSILSEVLANVLCGSFCHTTCLKCSAHNLNLLLTHFAFSELLSNWLSVLLLCFLSM